MHACGVDGEGHGGRRWVFCGEDVGVAAARLDRKGEAGHLSDFCGAGASSVDDLACSDGLARGEGDGGDAGAGAGDAGDLVVEVGDAQVAGAFAEPLEDGGAVELALVFGAVCAEDDAIGVHIGEFGGNFVRGEEDGCGTECVLDFLAGAQAVGGFLVSCEVEVAVIVDPEFGGVFMGHQLAEIFDELAREEGHFDVGFDGELQAHAGIGVGGGAELVGWVFLDDEDFAVEIGVGGEVPCDGGADHGPADDDDVVAVFRHAGSPVFGEV